MDFEQFQEHEQVMLGSLVAGMQARQDLLGDRVGLLEKRHDLLEQRIETYTARVTAMDLKLDQILQVMTTVKFLFLFFKYAAPVVTVVGGLIGLIALLR